MTCIVGSYSTKRRSEVSTQREVKYYFSLVLVIFKLKFVAVLSRSGTYSLRVIIHLVMFDLDDCQTINVYLNMLMRNLDCLFRSSLRNRFGKFYWTD